MMKRDIIFTCVVLLLMVFTIGISFAYFGLQVTGNDTSKVIESVSSELSLTFTDNDIITLNNVYPGGFITKTIYVQNTGTKNIGYKLEWKELENEFRAMEIRVEGTCTSYKDGVETGTCESFEKGVGGTIIHRVDSIGAGYTHEYDIKILFKDTGKNQSYNMSKTFTGKIGISEFVRPVNNCTFDGKLVQGAEYVNGQYTYRYMQEGNLSSWSNIFIDGWGVRLTDITSTDPVTTKLCTSINNKPIVSMNYMFNSAAATSFDLSSFDTSNVIHMNNMFLNVQSTELDLGNFDTSNVINMNSMFYNTMVTTLDLSSFDTSNVTDMKNMFRTCRATSIDLSSFDTSSVTGMNYMFYESQATSIDLSSFDTSNVTDMYAMFHGSQATEIDLISFDTSKVTDMTAIFFSSQATSLDLSNFDTSNVTTMNFMFQGSQATEIDLSSFDTSNVTIMTGMFMNSKATTLDLSSFDTSNVTDMNAMFSGSQATTGYARTQVDADNFNASSGKPSTLTFIVK